MNEVLLREAFLKERGWALATVEAAARWLDELAAFFQAEGLERLEDLTPAHLQRFHQVLLWRPGRHGRLYAANSVMQGLWVVRGFLRWAHREGFLAVDPSRELVLLRPRPPARRLLTAGQLEEVRRQVDRSTPHGRREAALFELLGQVPVRELLSRDAAHVGPGCTALVLSDGARLALEDAAACALEAYVPRPPGPGPAA
ncbi:MAG: site-specific integrase [Candidatus Eremiobacterota bacterium]